MLPLQWVARGVLLDPVLVLQLAGFAVIVTVWLIVVRFRAAAELPPA